MMFAPRAAIAALLAVAPYAAIGCDLPADARDNAQVVEAEGVQIAYRADPALAIDRHFSLMIRACADATVSSLTVDAWMPDHRHGMNYKPSVSKVGADAWRADGLLFHMPGKWELIFAVATSAGTKRATRVVIVR